MTLIKSTFKSVKQCQRGVPVDISFFTFVILRIDQTLKVIVLSSGGHPTPPDKRGANLLACNFQKVAGGLSQRTFQNNNHSFVFSENACTYLLIVSSHYEQNKKLRRIEERKVKIGGKDKVKAENAELDSLAESVRSSATLNPDQAKKCEEIVKKTKKTENEQIAMKNRAAAKIYEVD